MKTFRTTEASLECMTCDGNCLYNILKELPATQFWGSIASLVKLEDVHKNTMEEKWLITTQEEKRSKARTFNVIIKPV